MAWQDLSEGLTMRGRFILLLSHEEHQMIKAAAEAAGQSMNTWVRTLALAAASQGAPAKPVRPGGRRSAETDKRTGCRNASLIDGVWVSGCLQHLAGGEHCKTAWCDRAFTPAAERT
jgi:hypothetical protein